MSHMINFCKRMQIILLLNICMPTWQRAVAADAPICCRSTLREHRTANEKNQMIKITIIINKVQAAERQVIHCYFLVSLGCLVALRVLSCVLVRACSPIYTFACLFSINIYIYICTCSSSPCRSQINTSESESTPS